MNAARILIVEDEPLTGRDYQSTLVRLGYSVPAVAQTGEEALELVETLEPDLVLMNLRLGGRLSGLETAESIQQSTDTPIIFLSGADDAQSINQARASYPYGYVMKPAAEADLKFAVESALKRASRLSAQGTHTQTVLQTLQSIEMGVIAADLAGNIAFINRTAEVLTGWTSEEAMGTPIQDVFQVHSAHEEQRADGKDRLAWLRRKDGTQIEIVDRSAPLQSDDGGMSGVVIVFREADHSTPRTESDSHAEEQLASIAQSISDPLFTLDAGWRITYANQMGAQLLAMDRADMMGAEFWQAFTPEERAECLPVFERALQEDRPQSLEFLHLANQVWLYVQLYPFGDGLLVILKDISERKAEEAENRRLERLEGLGLLARGFAHDFNNLLTVLLGNICLAQDDPTPEQLAAQLADAKDATLHAQGLVQQLMTFAKGGAPIKAPLDPVQLLQEISQQRQRIHPDILIHVINDAGAVQIDADPKQIRRVLENIFTNSERAMGGEGSIFVRCRIDKADPAFGQDMFVMEVIDSGSGMDAEVIDKAFEPFYTTRGDENATGLGLTVCDSIARAHGGIVRLQSKPGKGTITSVHLPSAGVRKIEKNSQIGNANILTPSHCIPKNLDDSDAVRILVLEDDTRLSSLIQQTLSHAGYETHLTATGESAIEAFRTASQSGSPFDVLIVDLTLKDGMGGIEALRRIREIDPDVRAIVSSGYNDDPAMADPASYGFAGVLPKPYESQQLLGIVGELAGKV